MKYILQQLILNVLALFFTSLVFDGLVIQGGVVGLLYASVLLFLGFFIVKPILTIITLPISFITLGLFSIVITAFVVFLITIIDPNFIIRPFDFQGFHLNIFLSYILISVTIQVVYKALIYIFDL